MTLHPIFQNILAAHGLERRLCAVDAALQEGAAPKLPACERCGRPGTAELHSCPYGEDIHGDRTAICNCCDDCAHQCAMDV